MIALAVFLMPFRKKKENKKKYNKSLPYLASRLYKTESIYS